MYQQGTYSLDSRPWFLAWNHWANPLGNYHEPMPWPQKRIDQAPKNEYLAWLWWMLRNPAHNFTHFVIGHVPIGDRYEWLPPTRDWPGKTWRLGSWELFIGWRERGSFSISLGRA